MPLIFSNLRRVFLADSSTPEFLFSNSLEPGPNIRASFNIK